MNEISREEAIKVLRTDNCVDCACGSSIVPTTQCKWECNYKNSVIKAISDMEKLEKIEEVINDNGYTNHSDFVIRGLAYDEIEQIVKGTE